MAVYRVARFCFRIALTEHLRKHTGEMPFECDICHKRFSRLANYRAHAAIHENLRRFACDICGKRFNRQSIQQRHMKTHMRDTIKTSHVCRVCGEAFNKVRFVRKASTSSPKSRDVTGQESQEKVSKKIVGQGKSGKVRENACKVSKIFYFDLNISKTVDLDHNHWL